jgi:hypothetical protein
MGLDGRLAFAPVTEMTEDFMRDAERLMQVHRNEAQREGLDDEGDDDTDSLIGSP